jgi:hypothetical protein
MRRPEFIRHSAYKLMFYLGIVDVLAALVGGVLCGVIYIRGDIFCTNPNFVYIVSCFPAGMFSQYIVLSVRRRIVRSCKLSNIGPGASKRSFTRNHFRKVEIAITFFPEGISKTFLCKPPLNHTTF